MQDFFWIFFELFFGLFWPFLASNLRGFPALVSRPENKRKTFFDFSLNFFWPPEIPLAIRVAREGGSAPNAFGGDVKQVAASPTFSLASSKPPSPRYGAPGGLLDPPSERCSDRHEQGAAAR